MTVDNVSLTFRERKSFFRHRYHKILENVSFEVFKGETLGVIGKNGCGKSSLLKVMCGIYEPDIGEISRKNSSASLLTLAAGFDNELSGIDNAIISSMLLGYSKKEAIKLLDSIRELSELGDSFYNPVKTYSSGMRSRLGFSVAVTLKADVLLIDESLGVGDSRFRQKAEKIIVDKINSDQTVIFVSHSINQIKRLCNRVVWLESGRVKEIGKTSDICRKYEADLL